MKNPITKLFVAAITFMVVSLLLGSYIVKTTKPEKIKTLQQEVATLQQIKEAVLGKYVPDSLKETSMKASHDLMYATSGNDEYWAAKRALSQTEDYVKKCEPCKYVDNLLQAKISELEKLEKN
ncbi:TPA: hypothetical protein DCZ39_03345 [Patescibacteria group bacterium]|nr:hypothetical protein [Candidatus Gracilibacteria bacterium]